MPALEALVGAGVFYGAAGAEARAMAGRDVYVIGAGNSAGQAALHLARYAASVAMVVRGPGLRASMSDYLVTEITRTGNIHIRPATEVVDGGGGCSLETLTLRHRGTGATETVAAAGLFVMVGTEPRTASGSRRRSVKAPPPSSSCTTTCRRSTAGRQQRPAVVRRPATRSPTR